MLSHSVFVHMQQVSVAKHFRKYEVDGTVHGFDVSWLRRYLDGLGQSGKHQAVPGKDDLFVPEGFDSFFSNLKQFPLSIGDQAFNSPDLSSKELTCLIKRQDRVENVLFLKIPVFSDIVNAAKNLACFITDNSGNLVGCPDEKFSLFAFAVRVLSRVESALAMKHLAQQIIGGFFRHAFEVRVPGQAIDLSIDADELSIVVEHLFEMRHEPFFID